MPVVSNTSPIWNLATIERLHLLHEQFPDIRIPEDVWNELQVMRDCPEVSRIPSVLDEMSRLRNEAGFFIAESLFRYVQKEAGELL